MTKHEMLIIRACKSTNPQQRLFSFYRRFYCGGIKGHYNLISIMTPIVEKYSNLTISDTINGLNPNSTINLMNPDEEYWERVLRVFINTFRFTSKLELQKSGFMPPLYWRLRR